MNITQLVDKYQPKVSPLTQSISDALYAAYRDGLIDGMASTLPTVDAGFGTYLKPFAANSPWNSKPVNPVFGSFSIPMDKYKPMIAPGDFSTSFYLAKDSDLPITVNGVLDQESGVTGPITFPRWPADAKPAAASDGHIDVLDAVTGIIHSLWVAKIDAAGVWTARLYAWEKIDGSGFGDPSHYYKGARAAAVPTSAGIIRKHEINDGKDQYEHALAMSLTFSALSRLKPGYIYPATSADSDYSRNTGEISEGALLMLPPTFDLSKITSAAIRKVAKTLMTYGAYVVDRNDGTPFVIYQEIGTPGIAAWQQSADTELIQKALRMATATDFVDGNGNPYQPNKNLNLLSFRGKWEQSQNNGPAGLYDSYSGSRLYAKSDKSSREFTYSPLSAVTWSTPKSGETFTVTPAIIGNAQMQFQVKVVVAGKEVIKFDSGAMKAGAAGKDFVWPAGGYGVLIVEHPAGDSSIVTGSLVRKTS